MRAMKIECKYMNMRIIILAAISLSLWVGCTSAHKTTTPANTPKLTFWECRTIPYTNQFALDLYQNPEFTRLKQEGWTFMGASSFVFGSWSTIGDFPISTSG